MNLFNHTIESCIDWSFAFQSQLNILVKGIIMCFRKTVTRHKPQHPPQKTTTYIHHINYSTRSIFLHTTQLPTPLIEESITPKFTNPIATTSQPIRTIPSTAILKRKCPTLNNKIHKLTRKSSPEPLVSLSLTPLTSHQPSQHPYMSLFTFLTIFPRTVAELLSINPQRPREMTVCIIFKSLFIKYI